MGHGRCEHDHRFRSHAASVFSHAALHDRTERTDRRSTVVERLPAVGRNECVDDKQLETRRHVQSRIFVATRDFGIARRQRQQRYQQDERLVPVYCEHKEAVALQRGLTVTILPAILAETSEATPFGSGRTS